MCCENTKLGYYLHYKSEFKIESYIDIIDVDKFRKALVNFRCASHCLMIEKGRHYCISRENRHCPYCETVLEDEFHFVLVCPLYSTLRSTYIPLKYINNPTLYNFYNLMSSQNNEYIRNLAMFIFHGLKEREHFLSVFE